MQNLTGNFRARRRRDKDLKQWLIVALISISGLAMLLANELDTAHMPLAHMPLAHIPGEAW